MLSQLPCPLLGHKGLQRTLKQIIVGGEAQTPAQISSVIRAASRRRDGLQMDYPPGELQRLDLATVPKQFAYPQFIVRTVLHHRLHFQTLDCHVYQFQLAQRFDNPYVFGVFITDESRALIDFCLASQQAAKRRLVLIKLMRAICTPESVNKRLGH